jgi:hypothetical protein
MAGRSPRAQRPSATTKAAREIPRAVPQGNPETIARKVREAFCDRDLEAVVALSAG